MVHTKYLWKKLMNALMIFVLKIFLELNFVCKKKKKLIILTTFYSFNKNDIKTFLR